MGGQSGDGAVDDRSKDGVKWYRGVLEASRTVHGQVVHVEAGDEQVLPRIREHHGWRRREQGGGATERRPCVDESRKERKRRVL